MIALPTSPLIRQNRDRFPCSGDQWECPVCGRPVNVRKPQYWIRLYVGGWVVTTETEEEIDPALDLGAYPIGADCLRKHPELKPWASRSALP